MGAKKDLKGLFSGYGDVSRQQIAIRILLPALAAFAFYALCLLLIPLNKALILGGLMIAYFIPPSGKESLIPIGIALGIPWWLMAAALAFLDVITALFMILNFPLMLRIPRLGPWISKTMESGKVFMEKRPWMARWRIPGVALFVFLPLQGTGGVGATVVGMMAGLTPAEILLAVAVGASVECLLFALGSEIIWRLIRTNLVLGLVTAGIIILVAVILYLYIRKREKEAGS